MILAYLANPLPRLALLFGLTAMLLAPGVVVGADKRIASIVAQDSNIEALARLKDDFNQIMTSEFGFPPDAINAWKSAVNEAFDPETIAADYTAALSSELSPAVVEVVIDFNKSDFRRQRDRISEDLLSTDLDDPQDRVALEQEVGALSSDIAGVAVNLFEQYRAPESSEALVEGYLRAMYLAAAPYAGVESAQAWVDQAREAKFADVYVENTFLIFAATLGRYPADARSAYIDAISKPDYITYERQASIAFEQAYNAAVERLAQAFGG